MCVALKYEIWNVSQPKREWVNALVQAGFPPLTAMILSARGIENELQARSYLSCDGPLYDPFCMTDMDRAAARITQALAQGEKIAVFGDYDVDGITSTCLLTDFLQKRGADCIPYIPSRLEEGYGLNPIAIHALRAQGVQLIVTVDCGITAVDEAELCRALGIDLVITDHHECKDHLPRACAVVDPHRPDGGYPHKTLSGVGVAFKLASALSGSQEAVLAQYADMVCLGTVADVMPILGENRVFVQRGLSMLHDTKRPGLAALMQEVGCTHPDASAIGFILAPRINAAGRMGSIDTAVELFLTEDPLRAAEAAHALCEMNRQRQQIEQEIYAQATAMLPDGIAPEAIVLADERWHQGVVGIVASRMAEEYCCPTFLICLDGEHGKASSRSFGGFNLFAALKALSPLLESYGGHELAAGFTIHRGNIDAFRAGICAMAQEYYDGTTPATTLQVDCAAAPELLTIASIQALSILEPCGNGCPRPVLALRCITVEQIHMVGGGRHMRLRLRKDRDTYNAIFFSATADTAGIRQGDLVDVAFYPQVNFYQGHKSVQLQVVDIHPACSAPCSAELRRYRALYRGELARETAAALLPDRHTLGIVWRYLAFDGPRLRESPMCLCRKIVRWSNAPLSLEQLLTCLDIFADVGLLEQIRLHRELSIRLTPGTGKADLSASKTMQLLLRAKES